MAAFADLLRAPYDPTRPDFSAILQPPSAAYWLGTDEIGRDVLSRLIHGARASLQAGLIAVLLAAGIGVPIGVLSGYFRGFLDDFVIMRFTDAMRPFRSSSWRWPSPPWWAPA
jgi:peptide/nickel transport system permease protein